MFKDPKETSADNHKRRTEKMETLKKVMLNPEEFLCTAFSGGIMGLEKFENYIYIFIEVPREGRDYGKAFVWGDYFTDKYREGLFFAEKECLSPSNDFSKMSSYTPYLDFSGDSVVECAVIDISTLPTDEVELIERNYQISKTVMSNQD